MDALRLVLLYITQDIHTMLSYCRAVFWCDYIISSQWLSVRSICVYPRWFHHWHRGNSKNTTGVSQVIIKDWSETTDSLPRQSMDHVRISGKYAIHLVTSTIRRIMASLSEKQLPIRAGFVQIIFLFSPLCWSSASFSTTIEIRWRFTWTWLHSQS